MPDWEVLDPQIRALNDQKIHVREMSKRLDIPISTLMRYLKRKGIEAKGKGRAGRPPKKIAGATEATTPQGTTMTDEPVVVLLGQISLDDANTEDPSAEGEPVSATADIIPVTIDALDQLSPVEAQILEHYEEIIAQGIQTFVQVGQALMAIRDQRLYRQDYGTFEEYLRQRWDLSRPYAYQLMEASRVVEHVSAVADIVPANEAQARPLTRLAPEEQQEVWREAVETAPASGITAKHVQATVKRVKEQTSTTTPSTTLRRGQAEDTRDRMGERGHPNGSWINVLSHCNRLCSSLVRLPDLDEILESWGPQGRQKAIDYLKPLYGNVQQLLWSLKAIDAEPYVTVEPQTSGQDRNEDTVEMFHANTGGSPAEPSGPAAGEREVYP